MRDGQVQNAGYRISVGVDGPGLSRTARIYSQLFQVVLSTDLPVTASPIQPGAIAGAVIGTLLCVIVLLWVVWNLLRCKGVEVKGIPGLKRRRNSTEALELGETRKTAIVDGRETEIIITNHQKTDLLAGFDAQAPGQYR